jgi:hypothetical protein
MSSGPSSPYSYGGVDVFMMLAAIFVLLKLFDVIDWSWWWVLSPIWFGAVFFIVSIALGLYFVRDYTDQGDGP